MEARTQLRTDDDAVDHHLDVVLEFLVECDRVGEIVQLAVDPRSDVAEPLRLVEDVAMLALAPLHHRRGDQQPRPLGEEEHLVRDLLDGLLADLASAIRTVRMSDTCIHETQVVVDLGDRADR